MINWKNIRIVRFPNGKYALRKGWVFYKYYDVRGCGYHDWECADGLWGCLYDWRHRYDFWFKDCLTNDYNRVYEAYKLSMGIR